MNKNIITPEVIAELMNSKQSEIVVAACELFVDRDDIPASTIVIGLNHPSGRRHAIKACQGRKDIPIENIKAIIMDNAEFAITRKYAFNACYGRDDVPIELIEYGIRESRDPLFNVQFAAARACTGRTDIPVEKIIAWASSRDKYLRLAAMLASQNRHDVPFGVIEKCLQDESGSVRQEASNACEGRNEVPLQTIARLMSVRSVHSHRAAVHCAEGRHDIPLELLEKWMRSECYKTSREAVMFMCIGRGNPPMPLLEKGLKDRSDEVRKAALTACKTFNFPREILYGWLSGGSSRLHDAAEELLEMKSSDK